jgi:transcriptional regulator of nitric oxide reductase
VPGGGTTSAWRAALRLLLAVGCPFFAAVSSGARTLQEHLADVAPAELIPGGAAFGPPGVTPTAT